jgi:hypothetical protein
MTDSVDKLTNMLIEMLHDSTQRQKLIKEFQEAVWQSDLPFGHKEDIFADLAHDFDYYEPDSAIRLEDPAYFGDEELENEIRKALTELGCVVIVLPNLLEKLKLIAQKRQVTPEHLVHSWLSQQIAETQLGALA